MIVDAHLHLFRNGYGRFRAAGSALEVDAYEQSMDRHGIAAGLVVCRVFMPAIQTPKKKPAKPRLRRRNIFKPLRN